MLTEIQTVILTCLLGPEDKGAFKRARKRAKDARYSAKNRERSRLRSKKWRKDFPEKSAASCAGSRAKKPEYYALLVKALAAEYRPQAIKNSSAWYYRNLDSARDTNQACKAKRYAKDPAYRLECACRSRINKAVTGGKGAKSARTTELIGCSWTELRRHLESLFTPGMTWENYGSVWHVDHKKPCAVFDLSDSEQQKVCFHWSNTQPLFATENISKGDKYVG